MSGYDHSVHSVISKYLTVVPSAVIPATVQDPGRIAFPAATDPEVTATMAPVAGDHPAAETNTALLASLCGVVRT